MHLIFAALLAVTQQWLVVSDLHVDPFDRRSAPAWYTNDSNWALFDSTVAQMRKAAPHAKVVVIAGDFLVHHFASRVHQAQSKVSVSGVAVQTMARVARSLGRAFPQAQFLITLGNNDDPCGDYRTAPDTPYLAAVARIWAPLVNRNGAAPQFERDFAHWGSYTARLPEPSLRAIVLDDVYWSIVYRPCSRAGIAAPGAQMDWFARELQTTPQRTKSVVLFHIPPGIDPSSTLSAHRLLIVPYWRDDMRTRFLTATSRNAGRMAFVIAGHTHRAGFRLAGGVPFLIAPAVSPVYSNNPSFAALSVGSDGTLQNYRLYAYDEPSRAWSQIFDFNHAYGVRGFTVASLTAAHSQIARDRAARRQWENAMVGDSQAYEIDDSWRAFWCAQTELGRQYAGCAGDRKRAVILPIAAALIGAIVVLAVVWLVLRVAGQRRRA